MSEQQYIGLKEAGDELGVSRTTMYYYLAQMRITTKKFDLDKKTYITLENFERIKAAKRAAAEGKH